MGTRSLFSKSALGLGVLSLAASCFGEVRIGEKGPAKSSQRPARQFMGKEATSDEAKQRRRQWFASARSMLMTTGLPFDPNLLLELDYSRRLPESIRQAVTMRGTQTEGSHLSGVYMADTLLLPATVDLDGETILLARRIVFDSSSPIVRTHRHGFHAFPLESIEHTDPRYAVGHFVRFLVAVGDEEAIFGRPRVKGVRPLDDGAPGHDGLSGSNGGTGANGPNGGKGADGSCGGNKDGQTGTNGGDGLPGGTGGNGANGTPGGSASSIDVTITCGNTGNFSYSAVGGDGGNGGDGGTGGLGGNGGAGGPGGDGASCNCPSSGGNGGLGGTGGRAGGPGGGGDGGTGADGVGAATRGAAILRSLST